MLRLTRDDIMHVAPRPKYPGPAAVWDGYVAAMTSPQGLKLFDQAKINNPLRVQHALATMVCETNLSILWESGAYSASRISQIFGSSHHSSAITPGEAAAIAALPVGGDKPGEGPRGDALFERAYGFKTRIGRGMGNTQSGDGARFRGLGLNQMTGRAAHEAAARKLNCSLDDLTTPIATIAFFMFEWLRLNCNRYADADDPVSIRKLVNTGSLSTPLYHVNGLPEMQAALRRAKAVITVADFSDGPKQMVATADDLKAVPTNANQPLSLMSSSEMQAGGVSAGASSLAASHMIVSFMPRAFGSATAMGHFDIATFLYALLSDPEAWAAAGFLMGAAGAVYLMLKRYKRYFIHGV